MYCQSDFPGPVGKHFMLWSLPGPSGHMSAEQLQYSSQKRQVMESGHVQESYLFNNQGWDELWGSGIMG